MPAPKPHEGTGLFAPTSPEMMPSAPPIAQTCPGCGKKFTCGLSAGLKTCWCMEKPNSIPLPVEGSQSGCYCPDCLQQQLEKCAVAAISPAK
jgi:hypothetical protein